MLGYVERMDAEGFSNSILKDRDRRDLWISSDLCDVECLDAQKGKLLKYGQAFTSETQSVVTLPAWHSIDEQSVRSNEFGVRRKTLRTQMARTPNFRSLGLILSMAG